jgi:hypothetical protein
MVTGRTDFVSYKQRGVASTALALLRTLRLTVVGGLGEMQALQLCGTTAELCHLFFDWQALAASSTAATHDHRH